jgi:hypothetical protein
VDSNLRWTDLYFKRHRSLSCASSGVGRADLA